MKNFNWKLCVPYAVFGWVSAQEGITLAGYPFWILIACMYAVEILARKQGRDWK